MTRARAVGFVVNEARPEAIALAARLGARAVAAGREVRVARGSLPAPEALRAVGPVVDPDELRADLELVVSLGGDGTILRSVELVASLGTPILGVNLGQLGYLTAIEPDQAADALDRALRGDHAIDERMLLDVAVERGAADPALGPVHALALNEAVLEKRLSGHTVRLEARLDGELFTSYEADALIVATPTGSTAYAFSARGPIIAPGHRAILLTPVSPHMLFDRSLVLGPDTAVDLTVAGGRDATLTVDGRVLAELHDGDRLRCTASPVVARLVSFAARDFHAVLKAKFGLTDR